MAELPEVPDFHVPMIFQERHVGSVTFELNDLECPCFTHAHSAHCTHPISRQGVPR